MAYWKAKNGLPGIDNDDVPRKKKTGFPSETETKKEKIEVSEGVTLDPGYEDIIPVQEVQKEGITPHSQKFGKKDSAAKHIRSGRGNHNEKYHKTDKTNKAHPDYWKEGKDDRIKKKMDKIIRKAPPGGVILDWKEGKKKVTEADKKKFMEWNKKIIRESQVGNE